MSKKGCIMFTSGLIAGIALGTAAGMLFAPEAGDETRRRISDAVTDAYYDAYDKMVAISDQFAVQFNDLKTSLSDQIAKLKGEEEFIVEEEGFEEMSVNAEANTEESEPEVVADDSEVLEAEAEAEPSEETEA